MVPGHIYADRDPGTSTVSGNESGLDSMYDAGSDEDARTAPKAIERAGSVNVRGCLSAKVLRMPKTSRPACKDVCRVTFIG